MLSRRRHSIAFSVSAVVHGVTLVWGLLSFNPQLDIPDIDFELAEVELIDPDLLQGLSGQPEPPPEPEPPPDEVTLPPPEPPPPDTTAEDEAKKQAEEEEKKKKEAERKKKREEARKQKAEQRTNFAAESTNADKLAPPTSTFHLLLVPAKIRKLPFAATAFALLEPWPDFDFLVRKGGLDPLNDFDHIVIASPNIRNPLDTFLAVDYKTSRAKVVKAIERAVAAEGEVIEWTDKDGFMRGNPRPADPDRKDKDPRWFVFHPDRKVAIFVRDVFLKDILDGDDGPAGAEGTAREFVDNITKLKEFAEQQPLAGMQLKMADIHNSLSGIELPFPTPDMIEISVEAAKAPLMVVKLGFPTVVEVKKFSNWWGEDLGQYLRRIEHRFTLKPIFDDVELTRGDSLVTLRTEFTQDQIEFVLDSLAKTTKSLTDRADRKREAARLKREREAKATGESAGEP